MGEVNPILPPPVAFSVVPFGPAQRVLFNRALDYYAIRDTSKAAHMYPMRCSALYNAGYCCWDYRVVRCVVTGRYSVCNWRLSHLPCGGDYGTWPLDLLNQAKGVQLSPNAHHLMQQLAMANQASVNKQQALTSTAQQQVMILSFLVRGLH